MKKLFILFLTVILCASTIIGCAPSANTSLTTIPASTTATSNWTIQKIPDSIQAKLWGVWGSSSSDVFAVGGDNILHYDGQTWSVMIDGGDYGANGVWGSSSSDVFAVCDQGEILHYNGKLWSQMVSGVSAQLEHVWGSSPSDVFVVGNDTILHYDGHAWTNMSIGTTTHDYLDSIWGSSSSNVFAVGMGGMILHYDGHKWSTMDNGKTSALNDALGNDASNTIGFLDIWGTSASDVFAVGIESILHYDGHKWIYMGMGAPTALRSVWGSSSTDVFVGGNLGTLLHYNGQTWSSMTTNVPASWTTDIWGTAIWGSSSTDVFVVGIGVGILHYTGNK